MGSSKGVLVSDASAGAAPATISTSHDGCAEALPTETLPTEALPTEALPGEQEQSAVVTELPQSGERTDGPAAAAASSSASSSDVRQRTFSMWQEGQAEQRRVSPGTEHQTRARTWLGGGFEDAPEDENLGRVSLGLGQAVSSGTSLKDVTKYV